MAIETQVIVTITLVHATAIQLRFSYT